MCGCDSMTPETKDALKNILNIVLVSGAGFVLFLFTKDFFGDFFKKLKDGSFSVAIILFVAFWIYSVDFSTFNSKGFVIHNLLLFAGLVLFVRFSDVTIKAVKYLFYGLVFIFGLWVLKKLKLGDKAMAGLDKFKKSILSDKKEEKKS